MAPRRRSEGPIVDREMIMQMIMGLRLIGIEPEPALRPLGWTCQAILDHDEPFRLSFFHDLWQSLVETTGHGVGLRLAEHARPSLLQVLGTALKNSASLGDALLRASRFMLLANASSELSLSVQGERALLVHTPYHRELLHPEATEFIAGAIVKISTRLARRSLDLTEVRFVHGAPPDPTRHEAFFRAPVRFAQPHDALVFDTALLHFPIIDANTAIIGAAEREAGALLERLPKLGEVTRRVRELIDLELRDGTASVEQAAATLGVHRKTLNRRLKAEGTTFQRLLGEIRYERAERYLREPTMSVEDVATHLGYSDTSAFNKAFKRWAGTPPQSYRQRHAK